MATYGGALFNYRLSFGLISAIYAREQGVIDQQYFVIIFLIILSSSLITAIYEKKSSHQLSLSQGPTGPMS